jgi:LAS superfamily LD-carboxypeptidase LdcB
MSNKNLSLKRRGIKVLDLARLMGVCEQQARNYLHSVSLPKGEKAIMLASLMGITVEELHIRYSAKRRERAA